MRKQLHEIEQIDQYILHEMTGTDRLVFQARILLQPELKEKVRLQRKAHAFLQWFTRKEKQKELSSLYNHLMTDTSFNTKIRSIFS